ncbi:MAG: PAS domain-containing sensor histidine kinase [Rhodospirillales bacterium]
MAALFKTKRPIKRLRLWARRARIGRKLSLTLATAAVASGIATLAAMTGASATDPDPKTVLALLYLDAVLVLMLGIVVTRHLAKVWAERRQGLAGSRLHIRLVMLFSLVAVTPAIMVAVFSALFLNFSIQEWFSDRVRTAIIESNVVAKAYLHEHRQSIRAEALAAANDLNRMAPMLMRNPQRFNQILSTQAALRSLTEALVVDSNGQVLARSQFSMSLEFDMVPQSVMEKVKGGDIAILTNDQDDRVRAVVRLNRFMDAYLLVGKFVDSRVLEHIDKTEVAVAQYKRLEEKQEGIQITFVMIFVVVTLLLLLAAVWIGMTLATRLVHPISKVIAAAEKIRKGDLDVRVDAMSGTDEISILSRAFNRMTEQLGSQRRGLIEANRQLDERRRFTETVLAGVSAGVIGLDENGCINLPNRSASDLLVTDLEQSIGKKLGEVAPEMAGLVERAVLQPDRLHKEEIKLLREGRYRTLLARIAAEYLEDDIIGYVITFDDITDLQFAQRTAAWADVARRIAHEIKNPLTPIQLSAERLRRKYLKEIKSDPETFSSCTSTIIRQVEDIGRMVDEFSAFARMPQPDMKEENLSEICRQAVFMERTRHPEIEFEIDLPDEEVYLRCDNRQIVQVYTNLLKNASESINGRSREADADLAKGHVRLSLSKHVKDNKILITTMIEDNGTGLPLEQRDRLFDPYVTTRKEGTGLGLAIVKKIMEDHNGDLLLEDREEGGAVVSLTFHPPDEQTAEGNEIEHDNTKDGLLAHGS